MKLKHERRYAGQFEDEKLFLANQEKFQKEEEQIRKGHIQSKLSRIQLAQIHLQQAKEKRLSDYEEKKVFFMSNIERL